MSTVIDASAQSIARIWNERALAAIQVDAPHPPAQARNLFSLSVCMYDAWAAYDPVTINQPATKRLLNFIARSMPVTLQSGMRQIAAVHSGVIVAVDTYQLTPERTAIETGRCMR